MTVREFIKILEKPHEITNKQAHELDEIVHEYPYFQAARIMQLKVLYSEGNYRYDKALKVAAVHVSDRSVLYDFINSTQQEQNDFSELKKQFREIQQTAEQQKQQPTSLERTPQVPKQVPENDFFSHQKNTDSIFVPKETYTETPNPFFDKTEVPKQKNDNNSISEWIKVISDESDVFEKKQPEQADYKEDKIAEKFRLIDKFLEANPKIEPSKDYISNVNLANEVKTDPKLMTETLAQVYVNQRKYKQAIQAYEILILKNPEKSAYFAAQIQNIKNLQQNNL